MVRARRLSAVPVAEPQTGDEDVTGQFAHDLRSPLAAVAMNLDFVIAELRRSGAGEDICAALEDCRVANTRACAMVADMVDVARFEQGLLEPRSEATELGPMVDAVLRAYKDDGASRGLKLARGGHAVIAKLDSQLISRALDRLLGAALRIARPDSALLVELCDDGHSLIVDVVCDAAPLSPEVAARLFDRRFLGRGRDPDTKGLGRGLGMYFVRVVARAHGGEVGIVQSSTRGVRFRMTLPCLYDEPPTTRFAR